MSCSATQRDDLTSLIRADNCLREDEGIFKPLSKPALKPEDKTRHLSPASPGAQAGVQGVGACGRYREIYLSFSGLKIL